MSYPSVSTTTILPTSGSLNLTTISALSGIKGASIGAASKPYRLSEFRGQDFDIPSGSNPIKFSNFRGAVSYNYNYSLIVTSGLTTGAEDVNLYYYSNNNIIQNTYKVKPLGEISRMLNLQTKGSSTLSTDTFALKSAIVTASWSGLMDHDVGLWMQINNNTYAHQDKKLSSKTIKLNQPTFQGFIQQVEAGLDITIAPEIVRDLTNKLILNPSASANLANKNLFYFATNVDTIVSRLNLYFEQLTGSKTYSIALSYKSNKNELTLQLATYASTTSPLCYLLGNAHEPKSGVNFASKSITVNLAMYPIQLGTPINFYMGPGPGNPSNGYKWGVNGSIALNITVQNTPLITVT